jgi:autotransporter strand-loop-strand O-heptosyltransferase
LLLTNRLSAITPFGNTIKLTFLNGARVEILKGDAILSGTKLPSNDTNALYHVTFIDKDTNKVVYETDLKYNHWAETGPKYYVNWRITVHENGVLVFVYEFNVHDKEVEILLDSKSLGDTIAWMPYIEEFRVRHGCKVTALTFWNNLFKSEYPNIKFKEPWQMSSDCYARYCVGVVEKDRNRNKNGWRHLPLQKAASDYLGLPFTEIRTKVARSSAPRLVMGKYVAISEFSTFYGKHWLFPGGWQTIVDYLMSLGYTVVSVSKEPSSLDNVVKMNGTAIEDAVNIIQHAEFLITVSTGPSWLAWALGVPVVIISGFTDPISEMTDCYRVHNPSVCHGCFNEEKYPLEKSNWYWCPRGKNFECSTSITPEMVKEAINNIVFGKPIGQTEVTQQECPYKIKLVHLLSRPEDPVEKASIASLSQLAKYGIEYIQHNNGYTTTLPDLKPLRPTGQDGQPLKPGHYGCWAAHKRAVEEEFSDDTDFLILCERDTQLDMPVKWVYETLLRCCDTAIANAIDYFSMGYKDSVFTGVLQSEELQRLSEDMYLTNKIIGLQFIVFPRRSREFLLHSFKTVPWYGADIWYNEVFAAANKRIAITYERYIRHEDGGESLIDGVREPKTSQTITTNDEKRVLFIAPHCSTGGMPQYVYTCIKDLVAAGYKTGYVEYNFLGDAYVVQRNKIKALSEFYTLNDNQNKLDQLAAILEAFKPTIVHMQEAPENFLPDDITSFIYSKARTYKLVETTHSSATKASTKRFMPDVFAVIGQYHAEEFANLGIPIQKVIYTLEPHIRPDRTTTLNSLKLDVRKKHILNVGLFAPWKNQGEIFEIARLLPQYVFHFVGNQAPNFANYWKPLMENKPSNCVIWGEVSDLDDFYGAMDLFLFSSTMETNPLVIKEALSWQMPVLMRNLPVYCGEYNNNPLVQFIGENIHDTANKILQYFQPMLGSILRAYNG